MSEQKDSESEAYWRTGISRIRPNEIAIRGYPIEELIGKTTFPAMIWLLLRGDFPNSGQLKLFEAALVASVDHGPHAPSIAIGRMAVSCGLSLNGAMASAVNALDKVHGGAGEAALELFESTVTLSETMEMAPAARLALQEWTKVHGKHVPGFGHRFHKVDPRVGPLTNILEEAIQSGVVNGRLSAAASAVGETMNMGRSSPIPMNIDGITATIFGELGFEPPLARGLFCLSRSAGILAHAWEQTGRKERNKGPVPRSVSYAYDGPDIRHFGSSFGASDDNKTS